MSLLTLFCFIFNKFIFQLQCSLFMQMSTDIFSVYRDYNTHGSMKETIFMVPEVNLL